MRTLAERLIHDERNYDVNLLRETVLRDSARMNPEQRIAFDEICGAVEAGNGGAFFLDGFGGTGKTFVINSVLAKVRSEQSYCSCCCILGDSSYITRRWNNCTFTIQNPN